MNSKIIIGILIILALVAGFFVYQRPVYDGEVIKIGAIFDLTGVAAAQGENSQKAIELAVKEINESGGVLGKSVQVNYQDDQGDPKQTVSAFYNLTGQRINLIIGPNQTPAGSALSPIVSQNNAIVITPSVGAESFGESSLNTYSVWPPDRNATFKLAEYVYSLGYTKVAILGTQQEWKRGMALFFQQRFEDIGGTISVIELPLDDNIDLRTEAAKINASEPDAVIFTNYGRSSYSARRLRDLGMSAPFFSVLIDETEIANAIEALEGTVYITSYTPSLSFVNKFEKEYGVAPNFPADTAYDAANILIEAIKRANTTDTEEVLKALNSIKVWNGASGEIAFDDHGNAHKQPAYFIVKDGQSVSYEIEN